MTLHYTKHHQTYITNLNASLAALAEASATSNLLKQIELQPVIKFNGGGHINHTLFWENLSPASSGDSDIAKVAPRLSEAVDKQWGSIEELKAEVEKVALAIQGSGWVWLVVSKSKSNDEPRLLEITTSKDQDLPVTPGTGKLAVLGIDMWEHAYYLQYWNDKKTYLKKIWDVINWRTVERRFLADAKGVYGDLVGLAGKL